ncbi:MAG: dihydroorotate dehydrogenase 2 [Alphaproteobacteria bacterium]
MLWFLRLLPPEMAHQLMLRLLPMASYFYSNFFDYTASHDAGKMTQELFGKTFLHPFGMAAGFDKNATAPLAMMRLGFAFVEVGTITPQPQMGNPPPRLFRLQRERAMINRLGFPNKGMEAILQNLNQANHIEWLKYKKQMIRQQDISNIKDDKMTALKKTWSAMERDLKKEKSWLWPCPLFINIGPNKLSNNPIKDFVKLAKTLHMVATGFVINISSPNTAGLRNLQTTHHLKKIIREVRKVTTKPLLLKLSPDLSQQKIEEIAKFSLEEKIDGAVLTNSTIARFGVERSRHKNQIGGLSGRPLFHLSTRGLAQFYLASEKKIPLIGVGGIMSPQDAIAKIKAGASLIESYSGFVYHGRGVLADTIKILHHETRERPLSSLIGVEAEEHARY